MAAITLNVTPKLNTKAKPLPCSLPKTLPPLNFSRSSFFRNGALIQSLSAKTNQSRFESSRVSSSSINALHSFDVVVVGAGIIGLTIARQFLLESNLSVAVVDASVPCSGTGATGAGQGYLWMVHKTPENEKWELAMRSRSLWETLARETQDKGMNPSDLLGWKKTGSLLVGRTTKESEMLKRRADELSAAGISAEFVSGSELHSKEPSLLVSENVGAAFVPDDYQLDARRAVAYLEKVNRQYAPEGRYAEFYNEPVTKLLRSDYVGEVDGVLTEKNSLGCKKAVVIAAGCWSGKLMHNLMQDFNVMLDVPVKPRKGHLLVLENFNSLKLNHGIMEAGYVAHKDAGLGSVSDPVQTSISMTATMDTSGNLILGSSRQFLGFDMEMDEGILNSIWERAGEFFPTLRKINVENLRNSREVRVGLRPYMPDGKPMIGQIPGLPNAFVAAGHEGEGLSLALGTAEMVVDMVLGNPLKVDPSPFTLQSRSH
ncbi:glycine oxidase [Impatiens glandulifera]|uniref:glycine oxidase n=1 Tax=Impatiens glandulifera TaxID=253017 RepID=UPI001FB07C1A|nr:glycine oxidase [Impatiens glandulifera]